jgi:hypothetical protein
MFQTIEASPLVESVLGAVAVKPGAAQGIRMVMERESEFPSRLAAQLTGVALDPRGRQVADEVLDAYWTDQARQQDLLRGSGPDVEVIIGGGFHAAVYAATRALAGFPKPLVVERGPRVGGTFAMTAWPTFFLNSRNRAGGGGLAGDQGIALNYLPGAPIQAANVSMAEYQTNTDMAFVIRLALAQFADVVTDTAVRSVIRDGSTVDIDIADRGLLRAGRVIDARGLGDPIDQELANGTTIATFPQFMSRMASPWPLQRVRRAAVIGGGDSGKCTVESFLGIAPQPRMAAAALDRVERVDWYTTDLPESCEQWQQEIRGRYQAIGRYLRPDRFGVRRLTVVGRRARPIAVPGAALIDGRAYDLVVLCTGNRETDLDGLDLGAFAEYKIAGGGDPVARQHYNLPAFRVGPHARLPFTTRERQDGVADIGANAVSMFRTASKTAALAATLPALTRD